MRSEYLAFWILLWPLLGCHHGHAPDWQSAVPTQDVLLMDAPPTVFGPPPVVLGPPIAFEGPSVRIEGPIGLVGPMGAVAPSQTVANPLFVPVTNQEVAWDLIVDCLADYFRIAREEPVRLVDDILTEGHIETYPQMAATLAEPHRRDSVGRFNRWQSTFQTIRRQANARVVPTEGGYLVELVVKSELEDLLRPEHATAGAATFRSDGSLPSRGITPVNRSFPSEHWIPLGRDTALEQRLLAEIRSRLDLTPSGVVPW